MATFTNTSKNSVATFKRIGKAGQAWEYNQLGIAYNGPNDTTTGYQILYNSLNASFSYSNTAKTSAVLTNVSKN